MRMVEEQFDAAEVGVLLVCADRLVTREVVYNPRQRRGLPSRPLHGVPGLEIPVLQELEV
jgi:hypothetical protein